MRRIGEKKRWAKLSPEQKRLIRSAWRNVEVPSEREREDEEDRIHEAGMDCQELSERGY